jgi:hypothetical protein
VPLVLATSGILLLIGGPMHPEAHAKHPLREELAIMTAFGFEVCASTALPAAGRS